MIQILHVYKKKKTNNLNFSIKKKEQQIMRTNVCIYLDFLITSELVIYSKEKEITTTIMSTKKEKKKTNHK
jgi:hypothetical protein